MRIMKVWAYDEQKGALTDQDIEYLKAANIGWQLDNSEPHRIEYLGHVYQYAGHRRTIKFITVDQTSESMLLLRFSDKLFLISIEAIHDYED